MTKIKPTDAAPAEKSVESERASHTPTPWHFDELESRPDGCGYIRCEADPLEISHHGDMSRSREENLANAAFIVKAVNSHDALVAELRRLHEICGHQTTADMLGRVGALPK